MPENTAVLIPVEPLTPEQEEAVWKAVSMRKAKSVAERMGWLTSPMAKSILGLLAALFLGAGAGVVSRFTAPPPVVEPVVISTDESAKLIKEGFADLKTTLGAGFGEIKTLLERSPPTPAPKPPEPAPPAPDPDDWGETALPLEVKAESGRGVVIEAKVRGECRWLIPPGSPCDRFESGKKISLTPTAAVDFAVGVVSIPDGTVAWTRIKAAAPAPKPPEPKPPTPPAPVPPVPPTPIPPAPVSALTAKLQAAYKADAAPATIKEGQRKLLVGLYEAMVDHAKDTKIATTTDLLSDLKIVSEQFVPKTALVEMRKVISAEIVASIGTVPGAKLDPELRPKAVEVFGRIAKSLGEVQ